MIVKKELTDVIDFFLNSNDSYIYRNYYTMIIYKYIDWRVYYDVVTTTKQSHPRFGGDYPQNLSISLCGGKEIKRDSSSNGE